MRLLGDTDVGATRRATYEDYAATPEGERWELLKGTLVRNPSSPGYYHQSLSARLFQQLVGWSPPGGPIEVLAAPFDVVLAEHTVVQPDILVFRAEKRVTRRGLEEPPEIAIEIVSPHSVREDLQTKRTIYGEAGVNEYWVVDPEARRFLQIDLRGSSGAHGTVVHDVTVPAPAGDGAVAARAGVLTASLLTNDDAAPPPTVRSVAFPSLVVRLDLLFYPVRRLDD